MKVLVACEESQVVCNAFRARGHEAYSCDIVPTRGGHPEWHIQDDAIKVMYDPSWKWDLVIAHPPYTYLCSMGIWWNHKRPERWDKTQKAFAFFMLCINAPCEKICVENPVGYCGTHYRKSDQIINPWQFGHEANKPTCLWLKGLPKLIPTNIVGRGMFYTKKNGSRMAAWSHYTSGTKKEERARIAAKTFPGIANAMAEQWGSVSVKSEASE